MQESTPLDEGIFLGFVRNKQDERMERTVRYPGKIHLISIGPTGCGKGSGLIIPCLADNLPRSILIIDPKGEAAAVTARKRRKKFDDDNDDSVIILNPFGELVDQRPYLKSHGYNPLIPMKKKLAALELEKYEEPEKKRKQLEKYEHFPDDAMNLAEALVRIDSGKESHWSASAQDLIAALIMYECIEADKKKEIPTLGNVRKMLTAAPQYDKDEETGKMKLVGGFPYTADLMAGCGYEPLENKAGRFTADTDEMHSIMSTAATQTRFLDSIPIRKDLASENNFDFSEMKSRVMAVYVILPARRLTTHSNWLRLIVASALDSMLSTPGETPVLFMLDEFAQLGHLTRIADAMSLARGFGVQLWPFLQDLNQLKNIYGNDAAETFISQRGALTLFGPKDMTTARYFSELFGQQPMERENRTLNTDGKGNLSGGISTSTEDVPLQRPQALLQMKERHMWCLVEPKTELIPAIAENYDDESLRPYFTGLDKNPYAPRRKI